MPQTSSEPPDFFARHRALPARATTAGRTVRAHAEETPDA
jgi:hypothetical protein